MIDSSYDAFLAVADKLSFTKAAELLFITQPALSRKIASLEERLGFELFIRKNNVVELTESGAVLAEGFKKLKLEEMRIINEARSAGIKKEFRIGMSEGLTMAPVYSNALTEMWSEHPNVDITTAFLSIPRQIPALLSGEIDLLIHMSDHILDETRLSYAPISTDSGWLAIPKSFVKRYEANPHLSEFKDEVFLVLDSQECQFITECQMKTFERAGIQPFIRTVPNLTTMFSFLEAGMGISTLAGRLSLKDSSQVEFVKVPELGEYTEAVIWRAGDNNPLIAEFTEKSRKNSELAGKQCLDYNY